MLRLAARYYLAEADRRRLVWRVPAISRPPRRSTGDMELEIDDQTWQALNEEACRQEMEVGPLATHAILYFIADWDSGRLAERLGRSPNGELSNDNG